MAIPHRRARGFTPLSEEQLHAMTTPRLLAYLRRTLKVHEESHDPDACHDRDRIYSKADLRFAPYLSRIRTILAGREHASR